VGRDQKKLVVRNVAPATDYYKEAYDMKITPTIAKGKLDSAISAISDISWMYSRDPESDFTRERKLPMNSVLRLLLKFSGKSLQNELSTYYISPERVYQNVPTKSAFTQQRQKLLWEGCYALFRSFTDSLQYLKTFDGYRLLACDGSTVSIPRNEEESEYSVKTRDDRRSFNQLHINSLFDIMNRIYVDAIVDPGWNRKESAALITMVNHLNNPESTIVRADRGFEGYKTVAHMIESMINFVIRAKDLDSNGFLHTLHLPPEGEIDIDVNRILTLSRRQIYQNNENYVWIHRHAFDLWDSSDMYSIRFRLVRIQLSDGSYECLVTNLPRDKFPPKKLKKLYSLRWGIENAYRDLKYTVDLLHFHGKSAHAVLQEIFSSLTMFNYCAYLCVHADILHVSKHTKYRYKVNFANAVGPCRSYLHGSIDEVELLDRLRLAPTPIRPNRHSPRHRLKEQSSREFNYRAS
jgi:hypothetical protein